jgi:hypothetical protein
MAHLQGSQRRRRRRRWRATGLALYDFQATRSGQLSIRAGDCLALENTERDDWWLARAATTTHDDCPMKDGGDKDSAVGVSQPRVGYVPASYVRKIRAAAAATTTPPAGSGDGDGGSDSGSASDATTGDSDNDSDADVVGGQEGADDYVERLVRRYRCGAELSVRRHSRHVLASATAREIPMAISLTHPCIAAQPREEASRALPSRPEGGLQPPGALREA